MPTTENYETMDGPGFTESTIPYATEVTITPENQEENDQNNLERNDLDQNSNRTKLIDMTPQRSSSATPCASSDAIEVLRRQRKTKEPCPSLKREHIDLLLIYLNNPDIVHEPLFLMQLKLSNFPRVKRYSVWKQMNIWSQYFCCRTVNGCEMLCLRATQKMVLPQERYQEVMRDAHEGVGEFKKWQKSHNSFHRTFTLIEQRYGVTGREFGMSKFAVYDYVAKCAGCVPNIKRLPAINRLMPSIDDLNLSYNRSTVNNSNSNNDLNNSNNLNNNLGTCFDEKIWLTGERGDFDDPLSMVWEKPSPGSIWHNQKELAGEPNVYEKLLGVIAEIGIDMTDSVQGGVTANTMFLTKLYCAQRLVQEIKKEQEMKHAKKGTMETAEKNIAIDGGEMSGETLQGGEEKKPLQCNRDDELKYSYAELLSDYNSFEDVYVKKGELDVFLYDVNILAMHQGLANDQQFMNMVNSSVLKFQQRSHFEPEGCVYDTPIDLDGIEL